MPASAPIHAEPKTSIAPVSADQLWPQVLQLAASSRRLRALVDGLTLVAVEDGRAELSVQPALLALARSSSKEIEELLTKAAGRPMNLTLRDPLATIAGESPPEAKPQSADIRQHPLVKAAEELFGGRVVRVESKPR